MASNASNQVKPLIKRETLSVTVLPCCGLLIMHRNKATTSIAVCRVQAGYKMSKSSMSVLLAIHGQYAHTDIVNPNHEFLLA